MDTPLHALDDRALEQIVGHYEELIRRHCAVLEEYELYVRGLREWVRRRVEQRSAAPTQPTAGSAAALADIGTAAAPGDRAT